MSRPLGMAASGLPWHELVAYCEAHDVVGPQRLRWIRLLRAMDAEFLRHQAARAKERSDGRTRTVPGLERDQEGR